MRGAGTYCREVVAILPRTVDDLIHEVVSLQNRIDRSRDTGASKRAANLPPDGAATHC